MRSPWKKLVRRRVVVNLKSGDAIAGVLWEGDKTLITLYDASFHEASDQQGKKMDGASVVLLSEIKFIQIVEG